MEVDEDDPVVEEFDVFLSKQLAENLFLLQYPVRPSQMTYDDADVTNVKFKPRQQTLMYEVGIDVTSNNYNKSKGEQIAINVDGSDPGANATYQSEKMDKQVLTSLPSGAKPNRYAVGYFSNNQLHVTPLKSVLQMRPSFSYLDQADTRKTQSADVKTDDEEETAQAVTVRYARRETDHAKARRLASYQYMKKKQEEELWVSLTHYPLSGALAESERMLLYAKNTEEENRFYDDSEKFLEKLIPKSKTKESEKASVPSNVLSMTDLKKMSVGEQVKAIMFKAKAISFGELLYYLPKRAEASTVLSHLQQVALLVQGCWVVKSEVLEVKDKKATCEMKCRGRDYIMWKFTHCRCLVRKVTKST